MLDVNRAAYANVVSQYSCIRRVRFHRRLVDDFEHTARGGDGVLELRHDTGDFIERLRVLVRIAQERHELTDRDEGLDRHHRAAHADRRIDDGVHTAGRRVHERRHEGCLEAVVGQRFVDLLELRLRLVLVTESLHNLQVSDHLLGEGRDLAAALRLMPEEIVGVLRDLPRHDEAERGQQDDKQGDERLDRDHEHEGAEDGQHAGKQLREAHKQALRELVDVRDHAAREVARRVRVEVADRQLLDVVEGLRTDVLHHAEGHDVVDVVHDPLRERRHEDHEAHELEDLQERHPVDLARPDDRVDRLSGQDRNVERQHHGHRREQDAEDHVPAIILDIMKDALDGLRVIRGHLSRFSLRHHCTSFPSFCASANAFCPTSSLRSAAGRPPAASDAGSASVRLPVCAASSLRSASAWLSCDRQISW